MGWVRDVGGGVGWVGRCVSGVGIVYGKLWKYPHSATPRIPTQSPYNTKARQTPLSPPNTNSHPPYLHYIHPTQHHSRVNSTPTNPTRPSTISKTLRTLSHKKTHPTPSKPDPLPHLNPTPPYPLHVLSYHPNPYPPTLYAHPIAKTLISPSKAHMSLGKFCCTLTIEYKCKTSHINKRL